jgi:hypothetical protein
MSQHGFTTDQEIELNIVNEGFSISPGDEGGISRADDWALREMITEMMWGKTLFSYMAWTRLLCVKPTATLSISFIPYL